MIHFQSGRPLLPALILIFLGWGGLFAREGGSTWFELLGDTAKTWELVSSGDPGRILLRRRSPSRRVAFKILVLFPKQSSAYDIAMAQILDVFVEKRLSAEFHLWTFQGQAGKGLAILEGAVRQKFDLVFSMGSRSTSFIVEQDILEDLPVVTVCSKDPVLMGQVADYETGGGSNVAFTSLDVPVESQIAYLRQLNKNLVQVAIVYASANESAVMTQVEPLREASQRLGMQVWDVAVEDQGNAREELTRLLPGVLAAMKQRGPAHRNGIFWITGSTSVFQELDLINRLAGNIPVLSAVPNLVGPGDDSAVLSIGVSFENNARIAAIYAHRILVEGLKPAQLPVGVVSPPDIAINFKKAMAIDLKIPFHFFESASIVYDHRGILVRDKGRTLKRPVLP